MAENFYSILRSGFAPDMQKCCFKCEDATEWSYQQVEDATAQIATVFLANGVEPGDRVVQQVDKSVEAVLVYLACLRIGAVFVPLNSAYTASEINYFLSDCAPKIFICDPQKYGTLKAVADDASVGTIFTLSSSISTLRDTYTAAAATTDIHPCTGNELATIIYTSGTTGRSKGAMLTHDNLSSNALSLFKLWSWQRDDVLIHALPVFHVHGLFVATHLAMLGGSTMLFFDKFDADKVRAALKFATVLMGVPTFYSRLMQCQGFGKEDCARMRLFVAGSAPLTAQAHDAFRTQTGHIILERYGMSEAGMITSNPYEGDRIAGTVGYPLPGVEVRVRDDDGKSLIDEVGMIEARGPNIFAGYWNMPEKTNSEFTNDKFFITGDLGIVADDARVTIVGRDKDLIISGGYNIYPKEIEMVIDAMDGVVESAVVGITHTDMGEGVVAVLVVDENAPDDETLNAVFAEKLARFKHPRAIKRVEALPRNAMGKVQKNVLRENYADTFK